MITKETKMEISIATAFGGIVLGLLICMGLIFIDIFLVELGIKPYTIITLSICAGLVIMPIAIKILVAIAKPSV